MTRVFVAEDDFKVAQVIRQFTERIQGFTVVGEARNGKETLELYLENEFDLLLLDVYMPIMDGLELLREIKKRMLPVDVIVVTAAKEMEMIKQCLHLGIVDYILKPFVFERFEFSLQRYAYRYTGYRQQECTQESLDKMLYGARKFSGSPSEQLPKGFQQATVKKIIAQLEAYPVAQSVEEIANATKLSKTTAQRYLQYLSETDKASKELTYGTKGRPEHKYALQ